MKSWRRYIQATAFVLLFAVATGLWLMRGALAATGSIYLSPTSATVVKGDTVAVKVRINPGGVVNGVSVVLNYDAAQLQYVSYSSSGSPFANEAPGFSAGGGTVKFGQTYLGSCSSAVDTDSYVATVTFKALVDTGNDPLDLNGSNSTDCSSSTWNDPSTTGATITFSDGSSGGGGGSGGGGSGGGSGGGTHHSGGSSGGSSSSGSSGSTSGSTSGSSSSTKSSPKPTVTVTSTQPEYTQAVFNLTSKVPTSVYIKYSTDRQHYQNTAKSSYATTHTLTLGTNLIPGTTYYYVIVSRDKSGHSVQTNEQSFRTQGLTVKIGVSDQNHKPLKNKSITLHSTPASATTDKGGFATFNDVTPGTHHVTYSDGKKTYNQAIMVTTDGVRTSGTTQTAPTQNISVVLPFKQSAPFFTAAWPYLVGLVVLILAALIYISRNRLRTDFAGGPALTTSAVVVQSSNPTVQAPVPPQQDDDEQVSHDEQLSRIPDAVHPQPGSTVTPNDDTTRHEGFGN